MLNFTVGPVMMSELILRVAGENPPYFRTEEFSNVVKECERIFLKTVNADKKSRALMLTGSGTLAMEASVINLFTNNDRLLIVNGGSFGKRFCDICALHNIPYEQILLNAGETLKKEHLVPYKDIKFTGLLINHCETSTGVLYNLDLVSDFCRKKGMLLVIDAISSFISEEIDMHRLNADVIITGSQKALSLMPGLSLCAISERAIDIIKRIPIKSLYMDFKSALKDGERGQTPFTPAVNLIFQLFARLKQIEKDGIENERAKIKYTADYFRKHLLGMGSGMPFSIFSESLSNTVTPLYTHGISAYDIFLILKKNYDIYVCPNGGNLKEKVFRVGHIGNIKKEDNDKLIIALHDISKKVYNKFNI